MPDPASGVLSPAARRRAPAAVAAGEQGVLVIGGGVTGAGAALDAVTRGLRVALVEARDLAAGTSGRSSKHVDREVRHYRARVAAARQSQDQPDDHTADAARLGAPDVRMGVTTA